MDERITKCPNEGCDHVYKYPTCRIPGGENDKNLVEVVCPKCGTHTKLIAYNQPSNLRRFAGADVESVKDFISDDDLIECGANTLAAPNGTDLKENKVIWDTAGYHIWKLKDYDYEFHCAYVYLQLMSYINQQYRLYGNLYLKGRHSADKSFFVLDYKIGNHKAKAVWAKTIKSENDLCCDGLYLIHHNKAKLPMIIDGIFTRNDAKTILERLLVRWKYLCQQVVIATPFIGFNNNNSTIAKVKDLWEWLDEIVDMSKTKFITRKATYNLLKASQDMTIAPSDFRTEWHLLDNLTTEAEKVVNIRRSKKRAKVLDNAPVSFVANFHAKFYAGIFDDHVEVLVGSYNIHTGKYLDNIMLKEYTKEEFLERYMKPMCPQFEYKEPSEERVHLLKFNAENCERNNLVSMKEILKEVTNK